MKVCCRPGRVEPSPPDHQSDAHPTEPQRHILLYSVVIFIRIRIVLPSSLLAFSKATLPSPITSTSKGGSVCFSNTKLLTGSRYLHWVILSWSLWTSLSSTSLDGLQSQKLIWYRMDVSILVMHSSPIDLQMETAFVDKGVEKFNLPKKNICY